MIGGVVEIGARHGAAAANVRAMKERRDGASLGV